MPLLLWKFKYWIICLLFVALYIGQIAYTNHLSNKLDQAAAKCQQEKDLIYVKHKTDAEAQAKAYQEAPAKQQNTINQLSSDYETEKSKQKIKVETVTKYVDKIIERDVYRNVCVDADGMQSINSLIKSRGTG